MPQYTLTTTEAAALLGLSRSQVARLCASGTLRARKRRIGGREIWLIDRRSVMDYQQMQSATSPLRAGRTTRDSG